MIISSFVLGAAVYTIVAGAVIVVLLIGGYIFYQRRNSNYRDSIAEVPPPVEQVEDVAQTFAKLGTSKSNGIFNSVLYLSCM
ncbi:unnamed protein product [Aphanomyces euteiches]